MSGCFPFYDRSPRDCSWVDQVERLNATLSYPTSFTSEQAASCKLRGSWRILDIVLAFQSDSPTSEVAARRGLAYFHELPNIIHTTRFRTAPSWNCKDMPLFGVTS